MKIYENYILKSATSLLKNEIIIRFKNELKLKKILCEKDKKEMKKF